MITPIRVTDHINYSKQKTKVPATWPYWIQTRYLLKKIYQSYEVECENYICPVGGASDTMEREAGISCQKGGSPGDERLQFSDVESANNDEKKLLLQRLGRTAVMRNVNRSQ